jgi:hypothetical protein
MTEPRKCPDCGLKEDRKLDERGRPIVNLSPLTGQCVSCLGRAALARHVFAAGLKEPEPEPEPFDAKAARARNDS